MSFYWMRPHQEVEVEADVNYWQLLLNKYIMILIYDMKIM